MYSAFKNFTNIDIINFLKEEGLEVKEERGKRFFPITDKSMDVLNCFIRKLKKLEVKIYFDEKVESIIISTENKNTNLDGNKRSTNNNSNNEKNVNQKAIGVKTNKQKIYADKIIIATGGKSYPLTGSTGDGYKLAQNAGHTITKIRPSLVPFTCYEDNICHDLQGLSLKNVEIYIEDFSKKKKIYEDFGEMLFTHFGVSGPIILSASSHLIRYKNIENLLKEKQIILHIDLKPALSIEKLHERILRDFSYEKNKQFKNSLDKLLPQKLVQTVIKLSKINPEKQVNEISKKERDNLVHILKDIKLIIRDFRPIEEAIITCGGINIKEVNPSTMESKIVKNLYFAGEVLDVDAYTGGFNLQIAYSTGFTAGL